MIEKGLTFVVGIIIVFVCAAIAIWVVEEYRFHQIPAKPQTCYLLNFQHRPSTLSTRVAPIINSKGGMSTAVYTTGDAEKHTTIWDCGKYGRLTCDRKDVFQYGREESVLYIRSNGTRTEIVGIQR